MMNKQNTTKTDPFVCRGSRFLARRGEGGWLIIQANISMVVLRALHPRRSAADENPFERIFAFRREAQKSLVFEAAPVALQIQ